MNTPPPSPSGVLAPGRSRPVRGAHRPVTTGSRIAQAQALTGAADAKAAALLGSVGTILTGLGLLTALTRPTGPATWALGLTAVLLAAAALTLLAALTPRGGPATTWLTGPGTPEDDLTKLAALLTRKHHLLTAAVWALAGALTGAATTAALTALP